MRQSLSDARIPVASIAIAIAGAVALAVAGLIDQLDGRSLVEHATDLYAPHGKNVDAGLMYGLVYSVAAIDVLVWLPVLRSARRGSRWAALLAGVVSAVAAALALVLLGSREYGEQVFPTFWGVLALLSPAAGVAVVVQLLRRR